MMCSKPMRERSRICVAMMAALLLVLGIASVSAATATGRVTISETDPAQGWAGVMVSDGLSFTRTDAEGRYELPLADTARFVMIVNPPGSEPGRDFYRPLPVERPEQVNADFALQRSQRPQDAPFTFVHISDSHASSALRIAGPVIDRINALTDPPAFVFDTGDLCSDNLDENTPMESYGQHLAMPYFPVTGNHDAGRARAEAFAGACFERVFGPWYYAWTCGRYLFVGLPWSPREGSLAEVAQWLQGLLAMNAETEQAHVVVGFHHWDGLGAWGTGQLGRFIDLFREAGISAALMGHWHLARVHEAYGIPVYVTRNPVMGNRDLAAGGFSLFTAEPDGGLTMEFRTAGSTRHVVVVSPPEGGIVPRGRQPLAVNVYDTAVRVQSVTAACRDAQTDRLLQEQSLRGSGGWTWLGESTPGGDWPEQVLLEVTVLDETGQAWEPTRVRLTIGGEPVPALVRGTDWPMFQQSPAHGGVSPDVVKPPFHLAWAHATGAAFGINSPIVVDGVVYVSVENNTEPRLAMPAVVALDATTGEELWTHPMAGRTVRGTLAGSPEAVCGLADDGTVFALDPTNGQVLWEQANLVPDPPWRELLSSSPVLSDGVLVAGTGYGLAAYDARGGTLLWQQSIVPTGGRRWTHDPSPAIAGGNVLLPWLSVHALSRESGEAQWESADQGAITFTPTVAVGRVITVRPDPEERTRYYLQALDSATGEALWRVPLTTKQRGIYTSPVATEQRVYAFEDRSLYAVELQTGQVMWQMPLTEAEPVTGSAAMSGDYLLYAHSNGRLNAVNVLTQQIDWSYDLGTRVDSSPAVSGNALYVTGRDGTVYAFVGAQ